MLQWLRVDFRKFRVCNPFHGESLNYEKSSVNLCPRHEKNFNGVPQRISRSFVVRNETSSVVIKKLTTHCLELYYLKHWSKHTLAVTKIELMIQYVVRCIWFKYLLSIDAIIMNETEQ